jgi:putative hemolysin
VYVGIHYPSDVIGGALLGLAFSARLTGTLFNKALRIRYLRFTINCFFLMDIFILLVLILVNGLFVMSEIALVSARKSRLEHQAEKGMKVQERRWTLSNNPEKFLSAAQIGITLIAILTGVYSGERFGKSLQPVIEKVEVLRPYADTIATTIVVIIVTFLSIILGELIPKQIGLFKSGADCQISGNPYEYFCQHYSPHRLAA